MEGGVVRASLYALIYGWYTLLPNVFNASSRAIIRILGNEGVQWFE